VQRHDDGRPADDRVIRQPGVPLDRRRSGRRNAETLASRRAESWDVVWARTRQDRIWMLQAWFALRGPSNAANQWVRKAGAEHYGEHLDRLRAWTAELIDLQTRPQLDERDP
jgi:hypothetical protein